MTAALVREARHKATSSLMQRPVHLSSSSCNWHTPPWFLTLVTAVFQGNRIDLDPCSDSSAQQRVQARNFYTVAEDGLSQPWEGRVFVNPPFGVEGGRSLSGAFFQKAEREFKEGRVVEVLMLVKAAVGYAWFSPVLQWPHAWLRERIAFLPCGQEACVENPHGSVAIYLGPNSKLFCEVFRDVADIAGINSWSQAKRARVE